MALDEALIPELEWLATSLAPDESWLGPGPMLVNLQPWMQRLYNSGHRNLVATTYAAAKMARQHWDNWLVKSPDIALESILDNQPPTEQLATVAGWLDSPSSEHKNLALESVGHTKQLHWFHEEYEDVWFDEPGMWAVESSEYCVLSLTSDPYAPTSLATLATISVSSAINSFRTSAEDDIQDSLSVLVDAIRRQLEQAG